MEENLPKASRNMLVTVGRKDQIKVMRVTGNLEILKILVNAREDARRKIGVMHSLSTMKTKTVTSTLKIQLKKLAMLQKWDTV
jgi:hypothetical protein